MEKYFNISFKGKRINGEIHGVNHKRVILFSHGFGVDRHARGMFDEIREKIVTNHTTIQFDYSEINNKKNESRIPPLSVQSNMLSKVIKYIRNELKPNEIQIVGHSQGCIVVALAKPQNIKRAIFLAPPISPPYKRMKEYFSERPETKINESGESLIKRSDGSITRLDEEFWPDQKKIDPEKLYLYYARSTEVIIIRAIDDQLIVDENYLNLRSNSKIKYIELSGNHDFEGKARDKLVQTVTENIYEK